MWCRNPGELHQLNNQVAASELINVICFCISRIECWLVPRSIRGSPPSDDDGSLDDSRPKTIATAAALTSTTR